MKKLLLTFVLGVATAGIYAQAPKPYTIPEAFVQNVSKNGRFAMAQDVAGNAIMLSVNTQLAEWFQTYYPGNGNCVSDNGVMVGQSIEDEKCAIMKDGKAKKLQFVSNSAIGSLDAITPDGTRASGYISNPNGGFTTSVPFYCDLNENGEVMDYQILPYPKEDFFNDAPQFCNATYISDDGKTIAGIVMAGSGFYTYPIVYSQNENGEWNYVCPSQPLFNPDHLEIPEAPDDDNLPLPDPPQITSYMSTQKAMEWENAMKQYNDTRDESYNPWNNLDYYISLEDYDEWESAVSQYYKDIKEQIEAIYDQYWKDMAKIGAGARFIPNMALSPQGNLLMASLGINDDEYTTDESDSYVTYLFDLENETFSKLESLHSENLIPTQIMEDGTLVGLSAPRTPLPYNAYIRLAGEEDFISFYDYMSDTAPSFLPWIEENVNLTSSNGLSGMISFSGDMNVIAGGKPFSSAMMSYIIVLKESGVESIKVEDQNGTYRVFNLNGINVLNTNEKEKLLDLPCGLYIINGKKTIIR